MITLTDIFQWIHLIFDGFGSFVDILGTPLGDLTNSAIVQASPLGSVTLIALLFGSGITIFVTATLIKWVIDIFL